LLNKETGVKLAKVILTVVLLAWIVQQVQWDDQSIVDGDGKEQLQLGLASCLRTVDPLPLVAGGGVLILSHFVLAARWRFVLSVLGVQIPIWNVVKMTFMANFYGMVIPGMLGGDVVKVYMAIRHVERKTNLVVSVLIDRLHGIAGFVSLAALMLIVCWLLGLLDRESLLIPAVSVGLISAPVILLLSLILSRRLRAFIRLDFLMVKFTFLQKLSDVLDAFDLYTRHSKAYVVVTVLTVLAQAMGILSIALIGLSLRVPVEWFAYFLYVPLITIISAVPITPGGVGVMEELYLIYMSSVSNQNVVIALAILIRMSFILANLPGAAFALSGPALARDMIREIQVESDKGASVDIRD
jgi:glycosyltransferase 2 family protein